MRAEGPTVTQRLWTDMAALFADNAQLSYGKDNEQGRQAISNYFLTKFGEGTHGLKPGGLHSQMVLRRLPRDDERGRPGPLGRSRP